MESRQTNLSGLPEGFTSRIDLARAVTPRLLRDKPIHRWYVFPHSYSAELVEAILREWELPKNAALLDPFVGAGTTLVVAQEKGYSALGTDLSMLAVLASNVKVRAYNPNKIRNALADLQQRWQDETAILNKNGAIKEDMIPLWVVSHRLERAFSKSELLVLAKLRAGIMALDSDLRDFFLVALLRIVPEFSRAVANGGWFRWTELPERPDRLAPRLWEQAQLMIEDLESSYKGLSRSSVETLGTCEARPMDARDLALLEPAQYDGLITSPPYPNRHDYTRVFHLELLTLGQKEEDIFTLRHNTLRSHVEAKPPSRISPAQLADYRAPDLLDKCLDQLPPSADRRIKPMLEGYFQDLYLVLKAAHKVLKPEAKAAFVVGNARHAGVLFPVDEIISTLGEQAGYRRSDSWVVRLRGNSAQQMKKYGREPSRESVVMLKV